jgi:hypothetical protein
MISNGKELFTFLDNLLKPHGFIKKKTTWYLNTPECICFFHIEKSSFGGHYDHVMGCFLKEIHDEIDDFPKYFQNDLKYSLSDLADKDLVVEVLDFENKKFIQNEREDILKDLVENHAVPFLKDISSKEGIIDSIKKYKGLFNRTKGRLIENLKRDQI